MSVESTRDQKTFAKQVLSEPPKMQERCCGRKVTLCNCISNKTFLAIAMVVGAILLAFGILGLIGHFAPASGASAALQNISNAANSVASSLGSDLFTLSMFTTAIGAGLMFTGLIGLCIERPQNPPNKIVKKGQESHSSESD